MCLSSSEEFISLMEGVLGLFLIAFKTLHHFCGIQALYLLGLIPKLGHPSILCVPERTGTGESAPISKIVSATFTILFLI